jgi:hypothetical protein
MLSGSTHYTGPVTISTTHAGAFIVRQESDGTQIFNVDTVSGNVGIGSAVPASRLDVDGTLYASGAVTLGSTLGVTGNLDVNGAANDIAGTLNLSGNALTSSGALTVTPLAGTNLNIALSGAGDLAVNTDQLFVDTLTGNVGIGTAVPLARLDIQGGDLYVGTGTMDYMTAGSDLYVQNNLEVDGTVYATFFVGTLELGFTQGSVIFDGGAGLAQNNADFFWDNATSRLGIGTSSPLYSLDVDGTVYASGAVTLGSTLGVAGNLDVNGAANDIAGTLNLSGNALTSSGALTVTPLAGTNLNIALSGAGDLAVNTDQLYVDTLTGRVGIGSSLPGSRLDVVGIERVISGTSTPSVGYATTAGSLYVQHDLEVDGNVYLGDAIADNLIVAGSLMLSGSTHYTGPVTISTTHAGAFIVRQESDGTQIFNVDTISGNVGIGSALPVQALDVAGTIRADEIIDSGLVSGRIIYAGTAGQLVDNAALVFDGTNVGIGSAVPASRLDVDGTLYASGAVMLGSTLGVAGNLDINGAANDIAGTLNLSGNALTSSGALSVTPAAGTNLNIALSGAGDLAVNTDQLYVDTLTGSVGIGSSLPGSRLDVVGIERVISGTSTPNVGYATTPGSLYVQHDLEVDGNVYLGDAIADTLTVAGIMNLTGGANYSGPVTISTTHAGALVVRQQASGTQIFNVDTVSGNVGIGSALPGQALDVTGTIRADEIIDSGLTTGRIIYAGTAGQLVDNENLVFSGSNVGIGTSAPASRLDVVGGAARVLESAGTANVGYATTAGSLYVQHDLEVDGNVYLGDAIADTLIVAGSLTLAGSTHYTGPVTISTTHAGALIVRQESDGTQIFNVDTVSGNVGIGSALPGQTLDVAGTIRADEIIDSGLTAARIIYVGTAGQLVDNEDLVFSGSNVGIGTSAPGARLDVVGGAARILSNAATADAGYATAPGSLYVQNDLEVDGSVYLGDATYTGPVTISTTDAGALVVRQQGGGTQIFNVDTVSGNVGIGSAVPASRLDVDGTLYASGAVRLGSTLGVTGDTTLTGDLAVNGGNITSAGALTVTPGSGSGLNIVLATTGDLAVNTNQFYLNTATGNIGIGTSLPVANVQVGVGTATLGADLSFASALIKGNLEVDGKIYGDGSRLMNLPAGGAAGSPTQVQYNDAGNLVGAPGLIYDGVTGNVGIGTTQPAANLHVGTGAPTMSVDLSSDSAFIQGNLEVDGAIYSTFFMGTFSLPFTVGSVVFHGPGGLSEDHANFFWDDAVNRLGIGTTAPAVQLHVGGGAGAVPNLMSVTGSDLYVLGNIEFDGRIYGDGSALTGITAANPTLNNIPKSTGTILIDSSVYEVGGNVGIGTIVPRASIEVGGAALIPAGAFPVALVKGDLVVDGKVYGDGSTLTGITAANPTPNNMPKSDGTVLLDSSVYEVGGNVGVGSAVPGQALDVVGTIRSSQIIDSALTAGRITYAGTAGQLTDNMNLVFDGTNVGIGSAVPASRLDVDGTLYASGAVTLGSTLGVAGNLDANGAANDIAGTLNLSGSALTSSGALTVTPAVGTNLNITLSTTGDLTVNTDQFYVDTLTGNVGIGSALPGSRLDVVGIERVISGTATPNVGYATTAGSLYVQNDLEVDGNVYLGDAIVDVLTVAGTMNLAGGANYLGPVTISTTHAGALIVRQQNNGTQIFNVDTVSGNVGIGSAVPASRLDVDGTVYASGAVMLGSTLGVAGNLDVNGAANDIAGTLNLSGNALTSSGALTVTPASGSGLNIALATTGDLAVNAFQFYVDTSTGNVGVGTSTPAANLHVGGGGSIPNTMPMTGNDLYVLGNIEVDGKIYADGFALLNIPAGGLDTEVQYNDGGIVTGASGFVYDNTLGNVGIGSAVPRAKLDVDGTVYASGAVTLGSTLGVAGSLDVNGVANDIAGTLNLSGNALTSSGALTLTPGAGTNLNIALSTTGDLAVNTDQLYVDTLTGNVGIGSALPGSRLDVVGIERVISGLSTPNVGYANIPGSLYVQQNLEVDGNTYLGDALTDDLLVMGRLTLFGDTVYNGPVTISTTHAGAFIVRQQGSGTQMFNVDTVSGNVGISSATPGQTLDVVGNIRASQVIDSALTAGRITYAGTAGQLTDNANLVFDGTNVGIGTSAPLAHLQVGTGSPAMALTTALGANDALVKGRLEVDSTLYLNGCVGIGTVSPRQQLEVAVGSILVSNGGTPLYPAVAIGNYSNGISMPTTNHLVLSAAGIERMRLTDAGNIGIGSIAPESQLDVVGTSRIISGITTPNVGYATTAGSLYVQNSLEVDGNVYLGDAVTDNLTVLGILTLTGGANYIGPVTISTTHAGAFVVRQETSGTQIFNVDTVAGNVGVGSAVPGQKLDVAGNVRASQVIDSALTAGRITYAGTGGQLTDNANLVFDGTNVGIGTALAQSKLFIYDAAINPSFQIGGFSGVFSSLSSDAAGSFFGSITNHNFRIIINNGTLNPLAVSTNADVGIGGNLTNFLTMAGSTMFVGANGNVGIGSIAPGSRLDVVGGAARIISGSSAPNVGYATTAGSLYVQNDLEVDGNVYLGDAVTDNLTVIGILTLTGGANYIGPVTISTTHAGAFVVRQETSGTQIFNVDTVAGNVGIGSTVPGQALDVVGNIRSSQVIDSALTAGRLTYAGTAGQLTDNAYLVFDGTNVGIGTSTPTMLLEVAGGIGASGSGDNYFTSNVGIGTTLPQYKLDVVGTLNASGAVTLGSTLSVTSNLDVNGAANDIAGTLNLSGNALTSSGTLTVTPASGSGLNIALATTGDLAVNAFQLYVDTSTGNVGIGTSAPAANLHVGGGGSVPNAMPSTGNDLYVLGNIEVDGKIYADGFALLNIPAGGLDTEVQYNDGGIVTGASGFVYDNTLGNVGIGSAVPRAKLDVDGTVYASGAVTLGSTLGVAGNLDVNGAANDIAGTLNLSGNALTSSGGLTVTPAAGTNLNIALSGAGNLAVNTDQLYVDTTDGNVGIGSVTPESKLDVIGIERVISGLSTPNVGYATAPGSLYIQNNLEVDGNVYLGDAVTDNLTVTGILTLVGGANYIGPVTISTTHAGAFVVRQESSGTQIFNVDTVAGNVGIGSAAPGQALDVAGNIRSSQVIDSGLTAGRITYAGTSGQLTDNAYLVFNGTNVGIGTSAPTGRLDVVGVNGESLVLDQYGLYRNDVDNDSQNLWINYAGYLGGTTRFRNFVVGDGKHGHLVDVIGSSGNVGIGSVSPGSKLDVVGIERVLSGAATPNVNYATTAGSLYVQQDLEVDGNVYLGDAVTDNLTVMGILTLTGGANYVGPVTISTTHAEAFVVRQESNGTQIFNVDTVAGNVGVGSAVPGQKLDVAGNVRASQVIDSALTAGRITYAGTGGQLTDNAYLVFDGTNVGIGTSTPTQLLEVAGGIGASGGGDSYFSGSVGIATTAPQNTLDVRGTLNASGAVTLGSTLGVTGNLDVNGGANDIAGTLNLSGNALTSSGALTVTPAVGTNLNIALSGAGDLVVSTNQFYIDTSTRNVGVGTSAPAANLHVGGGGFVPDLMLNTGNDLYVRGNIELDGKIYGDGSALTNVIGAVSGLAATRVPVASGPNTLVDSGIYYVGGNVGIGTSAPAKFFEVAGDMGIAGVGDSYFTSNVGIATTTPQNTLDVRGTLNASGAVTLGSTLGVTGNLDVNGAANDIAGTLNLSGNALTSSGALTVTPNSGSGLNIALATSGDLAVNTNQFYVDTSTRNVGVGTSAPAANLHVGGGGFVPDLMPGTGNDLYVRGNIEFDGKIYGDGSALTGVSSITGLNAGYISRAGSPTTIVDSVIYQNAGNIGIGTTVPRASLEIGTAAVIPAAAVPAAVVKGDLVVDGKIYGDGSGLTGVSGSGLTGLNATRVPVASGPTTIVDSGIYYVGTNVGIGTTLPATLFEVGAARFNVTAAGNVGVGLVNPSAPLMVYDDNVPASPLVQIMTQSGTAVADTGDLLYIKSGSGAVGNRAGIRFNISSGEPNASARIVAIDDGQFGAHMVIESRSAVSDGLDTYERFRVTSLGNVGIATTIPVARLQVGGGAVPDLMPISGSDLFVRGNIEFDGRIYGDGSALTGVSSIMGLNAGYISRAGTSTTIVDSAIYQNAGNIGIGTTLPSSLFEVGVRRFNVTEAGNVGIGTTNPMAALQVGGNWAVNPASDPNVIYTAMSGFASPSARPQALITANTSSTNPGGAVGLALYNVNTTAGAHAPMIIFAKRESDGSAYNSTMAGIGARTPTGTSSGGWVDGDLMFYTAPTTGAGLVERMRIIQNGNVGLGTTAPRVMFEVDGTIYGMSIGIGTVTPSAALAVGIGAPDLMPVADGDDVYIAGNLELDGKIYGDGSALSGLPSGITGLNATRLPVASSPTTLVDSGIYYVGSNVGIGTLSPIAPLTVFSRVVPSVPLLRLEMDGGTTAANTGDLLYLKSDGTLGNRVGIRFGVADNESPTSARIVAVDDASWGAHIVLETRTGAPGDDTYERLRVTSAGNIGIGTTIPLAALAVGVGAPNLMPVLGGDDVYIAGNLELDGKIYGDGSALTGINAIFGLNAGYLSRAGSPTTIVDSAIYQNAGNVGIGTTIPIAMLDVQGPIYTDGNVGIGTVASNYNLDVVGSIRATTEITMNGQFSIRDNGMYLGSHRTFYTSGNTLVIDGLTDIRFAPSSDYVHVMAADGNVGFGTTTPLARVHISNDTTAPNLMSITGSDLFVRGNIELDGKIYGDGSALSGLPSGITGLNATRLPVASSPTTLVDSNIYNVGGNVGIGTTNPISMLEVVSNATGEVYSFRVSANPGGTGDTRGNNIVFANTYGAGNFKNQFSLWGNGSEKWALGNDINGAGVQNFYIWDEVSNAARLFINSSGNIGIGTMGPRTTLEVDGTIYGTNIGVGTVTPGAALAVGIGAPNLMPVADGNDVYIAGNLELDGRIYGDAGGLTNVPGSISSLTDNYIPRANGATAIENSIIYDSGTNIGIGTSVPVALLQVGVNPTITTGSSPAAAVKGNLMVDGNIYTTDAVISGKTVLTPPAVFSVTAGTGINSVSSTFLRIAGNGGAVNITADPQIVAGTAGQRLVLMGTSNANTVRFDDGTGLSLAGAVFFTMGNTDILELIYDAGSATWVEIGRSNN